MIEIKNMTSEIVYSLDFKGDWNGQSKKFNDFKDINRKYKNKSN